MGCVNTTSHELKIVNSIKFMKIIFGGFMQKLLFLIYSLLLSSYSFAGGIGDIRIPMPMPPIPLPPMPVPSTPSSNYFISLLETLL